MARPLRRKELSPGAKAVRAALEDAQRRHHGRLGRTDDLEAHYRHRSDDLVAGGTPEERRQARDARVRSQPCEVGPACCVLLPSPANLA